MYRKRNQVELKAYLLKRAESRKAYDCHGRAKAFDMPGKGLYMSADRETAWAESLEGSGLRFVSLSHDILGHRSAIGYYTDSEFQDETYRGVVLQFPSRNRRPFYVAAYEDSCNRGTYRLDMTSLDYGPEGGENGDTSQELRDKARYADSFAEHEAEHARDYNDAWRAGSDWQQKKEEEESSRFTLLQLAREVRQTRILMKHIAPDNVPTVCATLRARIADLYESIQESRRERARLVDSAWRDYRDAFNDGAGEKVLG